MAWLFLRMITMNKLNVFIATPISGFDDENDYVKYRNSVLEMIGELRKEYIVFSEIENFTKLDSYDDPGKSALEDFNMILKSDIFILLHPAKMQTSTMVELGYALAHKKNIIIISQKKHLPFLTLALCNVIDNVTLIETSDINNAITDKVVSLMKNC